MNTSNYGFRTLASSLIVLALFSGTVALAQPAIWTGGGGDGSWNNPANWDIGVPAEGTNAVIGSNVVVTYSAPMAATSFAGLTNAGTLNINAGGFVIDAAGSSPLVLPLGSNALVRVNASGAVIITNSGPTIVLATNNIVVDGGLFVVTNSISGDFGLGANGNNGGVGFTNNAGTVVFGQRVSLRGRFSRFIMNGGSLTCLNGFGIDEGSNDQERPFLINGGTANLGNFIITRTTSAGGLLVSNGVVHATAMQIGTAASQAYTTIWGGALTNAGLFTVGDRSNGAVTGERRLRLLVRGGTVVSTASEGIIVANQANAGAAAANIIGAIVDVNAGTLIAEKLTLVKDNTLINAWATLTLSGSGIIYLGAGGLEGNPGAGGSGYFVNFNGGTMAAKADHTNNANMTLGGTTATVRTADPANNPFNIAFTGVLGGGGALVKTGSGVLRLDGANTNSGVTFINAGTLALGPTGSISNSPQVVLAPGTSFDVSAVSGGFVLNASRSLQGLGSVVGGVTAASGSIINPGSNTVAGTLTFANQLVQDGGVINHLDLSNDPLGPNNDFIQVMGDLNVSGTNVLELSGSLAGGSVYRLIQYGGNFNGGVANFQVAGANGTLSNSVANKTIYLVVQTSIRGPTNVVWVGNNLVNDWDTANRTNWLNNGVLDFFVSGDQARFDATGAANPAVNIVGSVLPSVVTVDSTANYLFGGAGAIVGAATLIKTNSGTLTVSNLNTYTGPTVIGGGTIAAATLDNGGSASSIGASPAAASSLVFDGGTLQYLGETKTVDRGATLNAGGGKFSVATDTNILTVNGTLTGTGSLTKEGLGTLTLTAGNSYGGGSIINAGTLRFNTVNSTGPGLITLAGGTLFLAAPTDNDFLNPLTVIAPSGLTMGANNNRVNGAVSGSSPINVSVAVGGVLTFNGNLTNYTGTFNLGTSEGTFRFNSGGGNTTLGCPNATVNLGTTTGILQARNAGTMYVGAIAGGPTTTIKGQGSGSGTLIWAIGSSTNFPNSTYDGVIANGDTTTRIAGLSKVGSGRLTLTAANSYSGPTTISEGVLALTGTGSIDSSSPIQPVGSGILDVSGRVDGTLNVGTSVAQTVGGSGVIHGLLSVGALGTVAPGLSIGTLTVTGAVTLASGSTVAAEINRSSFPNSDRLIAPSVAISGTLAVQNIGPALHVGDTFDVLDATLSGGFESVQLPNYYTWNTNNLTINGTISVTGTLPLPAFSEIALSGADVVVNATNGAPNGPLVVLTSTNIALPAGAWSRAATNQFDANGNFSFIDAIDLTVPQRFYLLEVR